MTEFTTPVTGASEESTPIQFLDSLAFVRVSGDQTDGRVDVVDVEFAAGHETPMHVHEGSDETIHVIEGQITVHGADGTQTVTDDESVVVPRGEPHALVVNERSSTVITTTPAGFGEVVRALGEPADQPTLPDEPMTPADVERIERVVPEYGITITGPPPTDG